MNQMPKAQPVNPETEYRAIEAALLESARGRWFLAEHSRRARRIGAATAWCPNAGSSGRGARAACTTGCAT